MQDIPEFKITLIPQSEEATEKVGFKYALEDIGARSKIGGIPDFIQGDDIPTCPECHLKMQFYSQLDSIGDELIFGDCGMLYTFVCFKCLTSSSFIQSY